LGVQVQVYQLPRNLDCPTWHETVARGWDISNQTATLNYFSSWCFGGLCVLWSKIFNFVHIIGGIVITGQLKFATNRVLRLKHVLGIAATIVLFSLS
jgi:hypothetical protein